MNQGKFPFKSSSPPWGDKGRGWVGKGESRPFLMHMDKNSIQRLHYLH